MNFILRQLARIAATLLASTATLQAAPPIPDFTQGGKPDASHDWTLGPTGARGWIHTANGHSRDARQILITTVAEGSPADGMLAAGDVILGVGGGNFAGDARIGFAKAIAAAETGEGTLTLLRWRDGKSGMVEIKLPVLGSYSATAPYECAKSKRIFEAGCASLAHRMRDEKYAASMNSIPRSQNALALLASGDKEFLPLLAKEARWAADFPLHDRLHSWDYGYLLIFLSEYVMATGDPTVKAGLERLALETARGQGAIGTWGHRFALPGGNLSGYGTMNQQGLSLTIGMVLAREAGVRHADLNRAIAKSTQFLRWFVDKGAIPYGDHPPSPFHEDNGKCSSGAVLFDLLGDQEAAGFFARMATAAYDERERGHTGNYFNMLWALHGVARGGPLGTGAYMKEQSWYYDLARDWQNSFFYQGSPVGDEEHGKYTRWDCSGSYLLAYALPLKSLHLTGRKAFSLAPLPAAQVEEIIAAGRDFPRKGETNTYSQRSPEQLLAGLASWSPLVRKRSAAVIARRPENLLPSLFELLESPNPHARYGACETIGLLGPRADASGPRLRALLTVPDPWLQILAAKAIHRLGEAQRKASVPDLLLLAARTQPQDPHHNAAMEASFALFSIPVSSGRPGIIEQSLEGVDRTRLYPAIRTLLQHPDGIARGSVSQIYPRLTHADLIELLPDIHRCTARIAPGNEMHADGSLLAGLDLLSSLHITEGLELCVSTIQPDRWGEKNRTHTCLAYLKRYGTHAKNFLPRLREIRAFLQTEKKMPAAYLADFDKSLTEIETSTKTPELVNLRDFK